MAKSRRPSGRVTPKGTRPAQARRPSSPAGREEVAPPQVGRQPSSLGLLVGIAGAWIVVGIVIMVTFSAGWRFIPGIVAIGIGLLFLRGAAATVVRRQRP